MNISTLLSSSKGRPLQYFGLYTLFLLNEYTLSNKRIRRFLWTCIKTELFYIKGGCQNSGYCCNHLRLVDSAKPVRSEEAFEKLKQKHPEYSCFKPVVSTTGKLNYLKCQHLTKDNLCGNYKDRPLVCHHYPFSVFLQFDMIRQGCGYKVTKREYFPSKTHPALQRLIRRVLVQNMLE